MKASFNLKKLLDFLQSLPTEYAQPEDRQHCLDAGFDHHVVKPLDFERLSALIGVSAGE